MFDAAVAYSTSRPRNQDSGRYGHLSIDAPEESSARSSAEHILSKAPGTGLSHRTLCGRLFIVDVVPLAHARWADRWHIFDEAPSSISVHNKTRLASCCFGLVALRNYVDH